MSLKFVVVVGWYIYAPPKHHPRYVMWSCLAVILLNRSGNLNVKYTLYPTDFLLRKNK